MTGVTAIVVAATLPIMGWWGIPEHHVSRERYREAREAGFTHLMQYASSIERMRTFLDMAQAEGLKLEVKMTQLHTDPENTVRALKDHPALAMYHIKDEPPVQDFAKWASLMKRIQAVDSVHPCYLNLLADSTDPMRWLGVPDYKTYLDRAVAELPLPFVSADYYPCILADKDMPRPYRDTDGKVVTKEKWYNQLEVLSATARREKLPLSLFACDVAHYNVTFVYPVPTLAMLRLQQYVNLAYPLPGGAQARFLDDRTTYLGNQLESASGDGRFYGVLASEDFILVAAYGKDGADPELLLYRKRMPAAEGKDAAQ